MQLKNKVAIVTGAGRGIGRAIAVALAKEGANIVIASLSPAEMKITEQEVRKVGSNAFIVKTDVSRNSDVHNLARKTMKKFNRIDILVNNAGVAYRRLFQETTEKEFNYLVNVNIKGVFLCTKEVLPAMLKQKSGVIVNISSGTGKKGHPELAVYSATKFAVIGLTEALAGEDDNARYLRVYAVCPGGVDTQLFHSLFPERTPQLKPEQIAEKVRQLCLPNCKVRTGSSVEVYG